MHSTCCFSCYIHVHKDSFQELNSKAEGKFNRLKSQAKTKIAALNKELEKLREEHGASPLDSSAQVSHTCTCTCTVNTFSLIDRERIYM